MSQILVRFVILTLCGDFAYSNAALLKCPFPMRPNSVLRAIEPFTNYSEATIRLDMCKCGASNDDIVFKLVATSVKRSSGPLIKAFRPFKDYCAANSKKCSVLLIYSSNSKFFAKTFKDWVEPTIRQQIVFHCDHLMSNCKAIWWPCRQWSQKRSEEQISWLIMEMLAPTKTIPQRPMSAIEIQEKVILFLVFLVVVVFLCGICFYFK